MFRILGLGLLLVSCDDAVDVASSPCLEELRADPYEEGMGLTMEEGTLMVSLVSADPAPPNTGLNSWVIRVEDDAGTLDGCSIDVQPDMPDHGHGTSPVVVESGGGAGEYLLTNIDLIMSGYWLTRLELDCGGLVDVGELHLCIEG